MGKLQGINSIYKKAPLSLRELSSISETEGFLNYIIYIRTDTCKVLIDLIVWNANNLNTVQFKEFCSFFIFLHLILSIMLRTIQFNYQLNFRTIKICNVYSNNFLSGKAHRIILQKIVP